MELEIRSQGIGRSIREVASNGRTNGAVSLESFSVAARKGRYAVRNLYSAGSDCRIQVGYGIIKVSRAGIAQW